MEITEEQRRRAEANRLAALEKRKRIAENAAAAAEWRVAKCPRIPSPPSLPPPPPPPPVGFRVVLEVCSPEEFSVVVGPVVGASFPGEAECFAAVGDCLASVVPFSTTQSQSGNLFSVFKLMVYELILKYLKKLPGITVQDIPYTTRMVVQRFSTCNGQSWVPSLDSHYSDEQVDDLLVKLPSFLRDALLPFQLEGVRFGLRRGGRCLIADEMGLGKTLQAIAIACCFKDEGPILVVCPAVLRYTWAEELERWDPSFMPKDIHLVFGYRNSLDYLDASPRVVVISYKMLSHLRKSMVNRRWAMMIIDESHNIRCTKKPEKNETKAILEIAPKVKRIVLLSGTPSLSRPHLLGNDKFEYAKKYCLTHAAQGSQGKIFQDFSKGTRLMELNVLLSQTLMIRRLKEHVLNELPPKRRQIIRLKLKTSDIKTATSSCSKEWNSRGYNSDETLDIVPFDNSGICGIRSVEEDDGCKKSPRNLTPQEIGIAKLSGFSEWFSNHTIMKELDATDNLDFQSNSQKMIVFAHHLKVLDGIQVFVSENGIKFVRIDGSTLPRERKEAVDAFHCSAEVKVAIIGITAGGVGLDFSPAQNVVFVELPKSASEFLQAEDRAHRRGQKNAVNIYIFCAKDTSDESHWVHLNQSLFRVSSMMNGKKYAVREIEVDKVLHLDQIRNTEEEMQPERLPLENYTAESNQAPKILMEGEEISTECCAVIEDTEDDSDFTIRTIPLKFEDKGLDVDMENYPIEHEGVVCDAFSTSQAAAFCALTSSCKSVKADMRLSGNSGTLGLPATDSNSQIQVDFLRFEVSQHTGRIHLYICIPGQDLRPRLLFVNFLPEEVESPTCSTTVIKEAIGQPLKENPVFCNVFKTFVKEWFALRPIDRKKLLGKPLQLPLSLELCYLKDRVNHSTKGLLKGGSKRRVAPSYDVSNPLPEDAEWRKVVLHNGTTKEREYTQGWNVDNEPLCKLCQRPCNGNLAKSPEYFEDLFCSLTCFEEYRLRTGRRALRQALFEVERGICSQCKLDCCKLVKCIRPLSLGKREGCIRNIAPNIASRKSLLDKLVHEPTDGNAWHADHIIPVYKGGGECTLENMRTLCVACHYEVTRAQRGELKQLRTKAKEHLKAIMKQQTDKASKATEEPQDEALLVAVPGSWYSREVEVADDPPA